MQLECMTDHQTSRAVLTLQFDNVLSDAMKLPENLQSAEEGIVGLDMCPNCVAGKTPA